MKRFLLTLLLPLLCFAALRAQLYTGTSGLIHTPTAEMYREGDVRLGAYYMDSHMLPDPSGDDAFTCNGKRYNTGAFALSITPFKWVEISYVFVLMKSTKNGFDDGFADIIGSQDVKESYFMKDRHFYFKFNPLREGKWWPAIALGLQDFNGQKPNATAGSWYFLNAYVALTKHFQLGPTRLAANFAYRSNLNQPHGYFKQWTGPVGGIALSHNRLNGLRAMAEWTGREVNIGAEYLLLRHFLLQFAMVDCRYPTGGIAYTLNLF